ncbi:uncharacterized protein [Battus philenor]|uniref:uncharacterized protein n=1 Tax=Battus philenor TaxID=42288 RepID=UPI0035CF8092
MYMCLVVALTNLAACYCYAEYDLFVGFGGHQNATTSTTTTTIITPTTNMSSGIFDDNAEEMTKFKCPEEEKPINLGSYEVPTQRDLVLMTKAMLTKLFNSYNQQALLLIKDIKEASKASAVIEKQCEDEQKPVYRKCVKQVSSKSETIIKSLLAALKNQRMDVVAITEEKICNLTSMTPDPLELIKVLAQENASLQFALPGFLRLLSACSYYCSPSHYENYIKRTPHPISDLELVVKHFLTQNNYVQFILNKTE